LTVSALEIFQLRAELTLTRLFPSFQQDSEDYHVWARVASERSNKKFRIELLNRVYNPNFDPLSYDKSSYEFYGPGLGRQKFVDYGFNIYLESGLYTLRVVFDDGMVNLCSAGVEFMAQWSVGEYELPVTFNALHFDDAWDTDPNWNYGNCKLETLSNGVDAKSTKDEQCLATGPCYLAFSKTGEWVRYDFASPVQFDQPRHVVLPTSIKVTVTVRVASNNLSKRITLELDGSRQTFKSPGKGNDVFKDIVWKDVPLRNSFYHPLYILFEDGNVNMCSVKVVRQ
jgi:hypothetical protein